MNNYSYVSGVSPEQCEVECLRPELVLPLLGRVMDAASAEQVSQVFALLADPTRLRILHALSLCDELCVCDLAVLIGSSQSAVSHQLRVLRSHDVIRRRKDGRIMYYTLSDEHVRNALVDGIRHAECAV